MTTNIKNQNTKIIFINTQQALSDYVQEFAAAKELALDLEFDSNRYAYGFKLCLIQICASGKCFVIDPLSGIDCQPFFRLLEKPELLKILHAHGEDMRLLHSLGCKPVNIYDTDIAAKLLNYEKTSLGNMLESVLGLTLDKSAQGNNWLKRPLTEAQIVYASNDVIHLRDLMNALIKEAQEKNRDKWIEEENKLLDNYTFNKVPKESLLSGKDRKGLSAYQQFLLNEWLKFREALAEKLDKPAYQVISPELLRDIATAAFDLNNWMQARGIMWKLKEEQFMQIMLDKNVEFIALADSKVLSKDLNGKQWLSPEEWEAKKHRIADSEKIKAEVFMPVKEGLAKHYGSTAASFMLSNSLIEELIQGKKKLRELNLNYRAQIIESIAIEQGIDMEIYY